MTEGKVPITARELIEFAAPKAAAMFEQSGELRPLWHVVCANGEHGVIAAPLGEGGAQKDVVAEAMREAFRRLDAVTCLFMCESWFRTAKPGDADFDEFTTRREGLENDPKKTGVPVVCGRGCRGLGYRVSTDRAPGRAG